MSLMDVFNISKPSGTLYSKVLAAMLTAAWAILEEDPGTVNHANRLVFANAIRADGAEQHGPAFYRYFISNPTIQTNGQASEDGDIQFVVNSFFDTLANDYAA